MTDLLSEICCKLVVIPVKECITILSNIFTPGIGIYTQTVHNVIWDQSCHGARVTLTVLPPPGPVPHGDVSAVCQPEAVLPQ